MIALVRKGEKKGGISNFSKNHTVTTTKVERFKSVQEGWSG